MLNQTLIARDIFSAVWSVVILSAVHTAPSAHCWDPIVLNYARDHRRDIDLTWKAIKSCCVLSDDVMRFAEEDAPWTRLAANSDPMFDELGMQVELSLDCGRAVIEDDVRNTDRLMALINSGCSIQIEKLTRGILSGFYAFNSRNDVRLFWRLSDSVLASVERLLSPNILPKNASLFDSAAASILSRGLHNEAATADYERWLAIALVRHR